MQIVAFHQDKATLKTAILKKMGKKCAIQHLHTFTPDDVKPLDILKPHLQPSPLLKTALPASEILLRELLLSLPNQRAIDKALPFQIESLLPYPPEEALICPHFYKTPEKTTAITLYALKKEYLTTHLAEMAEKEIFPDQVSCVPSALFHYAQWACPQYAALILFHIGEEKSTYIALHSERLILSQTFPFGTTHSLPAFQNELQRIAAYLSQKIRDVPLLITGEYTPSLHKLIQETLSPFSTFQESAHPEYAIPLGLAWEQEGTQFLQGPFQSEKQRKKIQKTTRFCLFASLILSLIVGLGGHLVLQKRKASLVALIPEATTDNLEEAVYHWEKTLTKKKKPSPFSLTVPLVSDLLSWLSVHPSLEGIDIENIHYSLSQFPGLGKENEPYEAKVSLKFKATTPRHARIFHDLLLSENSPVNSKLPISWITHDEHYITEFVLSQKKVTN